MPAAYFVRDSFLMPTAYCVRGSFLMLTAYFVRGSFVMPAVGLRSSGGALDCNQIRAGRGVSAWGEGRASAP